MSGIETKAIVEINQTAGNFRSSIVLKGQNKLIDVKSILGLSFTLLSTETYMLEIHGSDEAEAKKAMKDVFDKHGLAVIVNEA